MTAPDPEGDRQLFTHYRVSNDPAIRNELVERHRGLAISLARRFTARGEPFDDLLQVAMVALLGAVERFDPERGHAFTSFATPSILGGLRRHFRDHTWAMKVPRSVKDLHLRIRPAVGELRIQLGRAPNVAELAEYLDCSEEKAIEALEVSAAYRPASLQAQTADASGRTLEDHLAAEGDPLHAFEVGQMVRSLVGDLSERERTMLHLRYHDELSQAEIGERVGLSQMQVSRILRATLERLRREPGIRDD